jgi:uncharacterized protein YndB with AHSA1/START domain
MSKTVRLSQVFKTDIDTLFDLWTKPEHLKAWHRPHPTLFTTPAATVDLRLGGAFMITMKGPEDTHVVRGVFTEIDRPKTLGLTWQWEGDEEITHVHISLKAVVGGTELTLIHEHPDNSLMADSHKEGWEGCFAVLESIINQEG